MFSLVIFGAFHVCLSVDFSRPGERDRRDGELEWSVIHTRTRTRTQRERVTNGTEMFHFTDGMACKSELVTACRHRCHSEMTMGIGIPLDNWEREEMGN